MEEGQASSPPVALSKTHDSTSGQALTGGSWFDSITGGNQFMSAGLGVMAVGAGLAIARQSIRRAAGFAKHQMLGQFHTPSRRITADLRE